MIELPCGIRPGFWRLIPHDDSGCPLPILKNALSRGRHPDPRITGMRRAARAAVTAWVLCLLPVLAGTLGYMLLRMPAIERALWHSTATQAHATAAAVTSGRYAVAAISVALAAVGRRAGAAGPRWTAAHPARAACSLSSPPRHASPRWPPRPVQRGPVPR